MSPNNSSFSTTIREATSADLADMVQLLSARDGQSRDPKVVHRYLWGLDPENIRVWLAYVGKQPVGITALYFRDMAWPLEERTAEIDRGVNAETSLRAGYWAHLYVEPQFRKQMIYPQLVLAMLRGMKAAELEIILTATRQPQVAEAHQKLGFSLVGSRPLRLRPLRPVRLIAKHKRIPFLAKSSSPFDFAASLILRRKVEDQISIEDVPFDSFYIEQIVDMMNERPDRSIRQNWNPERFRLRFKTTLDGTNYRILAIQRDGRIIVAMILALVERGNYIRAGVIVSFVALPSASTKEVRALLAEAELYSYQQQAELVLSLADSLHLPQLATAGGKYLTSRSENYHLLVYPKTIAQIPFAAAHLDRWIFEFADHDAF